MTASATNYPSEKSRKLSQQLIHSLQLPKSFETTVTDVYLPLMQHIVNLKQKAPLFISINGAQGSGKSTLTYFLQQLIENETSLHVANISLDDFYATRRQRQTLGKTVHPLLTTRGVPGTHDMELMQSTLFRLLEGKACRIPRFDKAMDDRCPEEQWTEQPPVDIVLFEGWCNHSPAQSVAELVQPINQLEAEEDEDGSWRHYVNQQLKLYQQNIFSHADLCIMLKAADFEHVYQWRRLQEHKLRNKQSVGQKQRIMSDAELTRFIQHYERISRHTLKHLPELADIVIPVNPDHTINQIIMQKDFINDSAT
jgi:D-glycerate 3-kinase